MENKPEFKEGQVSQRPVPITTVQNYLICPICSQRNPARASAYGFQLQAMRRHVFTCYQEQLLKAGFKEQYDYSSEDLDL
jgi:hypothetical protein